MSFQDDAGDFTMVSHALAKEAGLVCAVVYGAVWRYCQMKEGACRASLETIAKDINLNRATVLRSIEKLSDLGYLIDQTPDRRNAPHTYVLGRSVVIRNTLEETAEAQEAQTVAESNTVEAQTVVTDNATVAHNNTSIETVAECNATVAQNNATVAESYLNRVFKRDSNKDTKEGASKPTRPPLSPTAKILVEETGKCYLNTAQLKVTDREVGNTPESLQKWRESVAAWNLNGCNPKDAQGMLDWFRTGKRSKYNGKDTTKNGQYKSTKQQQPVVSVTPAQEDHLLRLVIAQAASNDPA